MSRIEENIFPVFDKILQREDNKNIGLNEIGRISIKTTAPLFFDKYNRSRSTGALILIDEATNETVGAGMIV